MWRRDTAVNVANMYSQFADGWNIVDKIRCIITDNARNMVAAIGRTAYSHLPCVAHCIQLSTLEGMTLLLTDSESDASDDETDVPNAWAVDLARYKDEDPIAETENPLTWWRLNRNRFPVLANFVKTVLCVLATSVPCKRLFSFSGYTCGTFARKRHHIGLSARLAESLTT